MKPLHLAVAAAAVLSCGAGSPPAYPLQGDYGRSGAHLAGNCAAMAQGKPAFGWSFKGSVARSNDLLLATCTLSKVETVAPNEYRLTETCKAGQLPATTRSRYIRGFQNGAFTEAAVDAPGIAPRPEVRRDSYIYAPCGA